MTNFELETLAYNRLAMDCLSLAHSDHCTTESVISRARAYYDFAINPTTPLKPESDHE